jgi:hypothetical protein
MIKSIQLKFGRSQVAEAVNIEATLACKIGSENNLTFLKELENENQINYHYIVNYSHQQRLRNGRNKLYIL